MPTMPDLAPRPTPCRSCPYRTDVPSGVWHADEYRKLAEYDRETWEQPVGVFLCHCGGGTVCRGWLDCHDKRELLALRLCRTPLFDVPLSGVPVFASGTEAMVHGLRDVAAPGDQAKGVIERLHRTVGNAVKGGK